MNLIQVIEALQTVSNMKQIHDSRFDHPTYIKYRYVPYDLHHYSASLTLSYAYDDWAIANVMSYVGLKDEAQEYYNRLKWYENIFDTKTKFFCPKNSTGELLCPETNPEHLIPFDYRYTEDDAWQYRFFVPYDTPRLIEMFGGPESFAERLDKFFVESQNWPTTTIPNAYYWAGNEHDLFCVWQFHYGNRYRSDLTQRLSRWFLEDAYTI